MRKFLLLFGFFALAVFIAGLKASEAEAVTTYHSGTFKNYGSITVYATYWIFDGNGNFVTFSDGNRYKTVGPLLPGNSDAAGNFWPTENAYNPNYTLWWSTHCVDPDVPGTNTGQFVGFNIVAYGAIDVSAKTPCGEPVITAISCPTPGNTLSFSWQMTGGGPYNVAKYHLFRSQAPDTNPDDNYIETVISTASSGSKSWGGRSAGATYYVRVSAESPQGRWSSPAYSSTPCQSTVAPPAPTNLSVTGDPACSNTSYAVTPEFYVTAATQAQLELYRNGTLDYTGNWSSLISSSSYRLWLSGLTGSPNTLYTWRARAGNSVGWSTWVDGRSWNVPYCPATIQGIKVVMPGKTQSPPAESQRIYLDGVDQGTNPNSPGNPYIYYLLNVPPTYHTVSVTVPAGYTVGYTLCYDTTTCHDNSPTMSSSVFVNLQGIVYADLWWHYYPTGSITGRIWLDSDKDGLEDSGEKWVQYNVSCDPSLNVNVGRVSVTVDGPNFDFVNPDRCNSSPTKAYYLASNIGAGIYTVRVSPPLEYSVTGVIQAVGGWTINADKSITGNLTGGQSKDIHFGIAPPEKPDLVINDMEMYCSSSDGTICNPGEQVEARLIIQNNGQTTASNFSIDLFAGSLDATCNNTSPNRLTRITKNQSGANFALGGGGAYVYVFYSYTAPTTPGNYTVYAFIDSSTTTSPPPSYCLIDEAVENNNTNSAQYSVNGFDLSVSFVAGSWNNANRIYNAGETAIAQVQVTNISSSTQTFTALEDNLGIWPGQAGESALPVCSNTPPNPPHSPSSPPGNGNGGPGTYDVPSLDPGQTSPPIQITFNVGNVPGTFIANAYVLFGCTPADFSWSNNSTVTTGNVAYFVNVDAWFETTGGDVGSDASDGSSGTIRMSMSSPPRPQSSYLLVGKTLDPSVRSAKWAINGYDKRLTKGKPYEYMAERFLEKAKTTNTQCSIGSLAAGLNYCAGLTGSVSGSPPSGNSNIIWFIDGNLTINNNITIPNTNTIVFVVSGDITVNTTVTRVDGVYITGGTFRTTTDDTQISGKQLLVIGAVYGANVNLNRKLGGVLCPSGVVCDNTLYAAEKIFYDPRYLIGPNSLLGSPGVAWKEIAP